MTVDGYDSGSALFNERTRINGGENMHIQWFPSDK